MEERIKYVSLIEENNLFKYNALSVLYKMHWLLMLLKV